MSVLDMERQFGYRDIQRKHDYYYAVKLHLDCMYFTFFPLLLSYIKSRLVREKSRKMLCRKIKWK